MLLRVLRVAALWCAMRGCIRCDVCSLGDWCAGPPQPSIRTESFTSLSLDIDSSQRPRSGTTCDLLDCFRKLSAEEVSGSRCGAASLLEAAGRHVVS